jgi:hypothetical protein
MIRIGLDTLVAAKTERRGLKEVLHSYHQAGYLL